MFPRFIEHYPELLHRLLDITPIVPAVHVRGHRDFCQYVYAPAYVPCIGHFFGETAEFVWPYLNSIAGQTRQMTNGRRQDTIIRHENEWNGRKNQRGRGCFSLSYQTVIFYWNLYSFAVKEGGASRHEAI
jgi:hypothetical protein